MNQQFGGPWTVLKLEVISAYLESYLKVFKYQEHLRTHYIDAFAGTGYVDLGAEIKQDQGFLEEATEAESESRSLLQGSAERALCLDSPFDQYTFIERSAWRSKELTRLRAQHLDQWGRVTILHEDANAALQRICSGWNKARDRAVVFLDPFGMSVDWETLQAIAATQSMDMWYLFPLMAVNRMLPRERTPLPEWQDKLRGRLETGLLSVRVSSVPSRHERTEAVPQRPDRDAVAEHPPPVPRW